ncbi:MAG: lipopolysaccharide biosynthesis protein [Bacilli bacterium]|nr:lipopolysaccharide biosynthesis protein [Bacilli bacterium]
MTNLKKSYIWNTLGSGFNSFNSLFYMVIVTRINGVKDAGIFTLSFATASMLYVIATYSGRTYQVTETEKDIDDNEFVFHRLMASFLMILISIAFGLINGYQSYKFIVFILLCLVKCVEAICDVYHGILQKNDRLDVVGKSLFTRSILDVVCFLIVDKLTNNLIFSCLSLIIVDLVVLMFIDIKKSLKYKRKGKVNYQAVFKIFTLGFFTFGISFIANYLVNAPRYAIDSFMSPEFQTIFGIIVMPASVIMLVNQFIIQPVILLLKNSYNKRDKSAFLKLIYKIIGLTCLTGIGSIILAYFLGMPVLKIMYGLDLKEYLYDLLIVLAGATLYTIASVLSNGLIILRKTKVQLYIYIITSILAFILSSKLVKLFNFNGAIYSYLIIMVTLLILYIIYFIYIMNNKNIWKKEGVKNERKN